MSDQKYILDDAGNPQPADLMTWARWLETSREQRIVAVNVLGEQGEQRVSTVFIGLDHSFGSGPPLIFETMVFGGPLDGECERYSTRAEAEAGHADMLRKVRETSAA